MCVCMHADICVETREQEPFTLFFCLFGVGQLHFFILCVCVGAHVPQHTCEGQKTEDNFHHVGGIQSGHLHPLNHLN